MLKIIARSPQGTSPWVSIIINIIISLFFFNRHAPHNMTTSNKSAIPYRAPNNRLLPFPLIPKLKKLNLKRTAKITRDKTKCQARDQAR